MPQGGSAVLARLHEAIRELELWRGALLWLSGIRRLVGFRGSGCPHRIRVRDQPDGCDVHRRPARCRAPKRALLRPLSALRRMMIATSAQAFVDAYSAPESVGTVATCVEGHRWLT